MEYSNDIIERYQHILTWGQTLLVHAHNGDWEALLALQDEYVCHVAQLADEEKDIDLDPATRARKYELLVEICRAEDSVRGLLHERMRQLSSVMTQTRSRQQVSRAYEVGRPG
ncbi:flagellar protein FliT [Salinisphaera sp. T31B1]|uniref:flagellar protein FliT n=1 Tax=Salinisphaera sp. T31B1 TaxID=727963 RepID=UPI00334149E9